MITGIYKIPSIKHAFFVVSSLKNLFSDSEFYHECKRRMQYFDKILRLKERIYLCGNEKWNLKVISQRDFLSVLEKYMPLGQISNCNSCNFPESLELLSINLIKSRELSPSCSHDTLKGLCRVANEDIIEIFI